jgi:hypothetical protein
MRNDRHCEEAAGRRGNPVRRWWGRGTRQRNGGDWPAAALDRHAAAPLAMTGCGAKRPSPLPAPSPHRHRLRPAMRNDRHCEEAAGRRGNPVRRWWGRGTRQRNGGDWPAAALDRHAAAPLAMTGCGAKRPSPPPAPSPHRHRLRPAMRNDRHCEEAAGRRGNPVRRWWGRGTRQRNGGDWPAAALDRHAAAPLAMTGCGAKRPSPLPAPSPHRHRLRPAMRNDRHCEEAAGRRGNPVRRWWGRGTRQRNGGDWPAAALDRHAAAPLAMTGCGAKRPSPLPAPSPHRHRLRPAMRNDRHCEEAAGRRGNPVRRWSGALSAAPTTGAGTRPSESSP